MHFYDFVSYCSMLTDERRLNTYVKALKETITDDSIVLDLGAGTGIFSVLACNYGAKKAYSVEVNPLIELLKDVVDDRGYQDRIEIIKKLSRKRNLLKRQTFWFRISTAAFRFLKQALRQKSTPANVY